MQKAQFFFARAFGAREALSKYFGGGRAKKQSVREPVRLTVCSFLKHLGLICDPIDAQKVKYSSLAPSALAKAGFKILTIIQIRYSCPY